MNKLHETVILRPILALQYAERQIGLSTDAFHFQVGCVFLVEQSDKMKIQIGYWPYSLASADREYDTKERRCLAVV